MTCPCRTCSLFQSDKNNPDCAKCRKRVHYVAALGNDLGCAPSRTDLEAPGARFSLPSRQSAYLAVSPQIFYE